jgi:uncharacterized protein YqeY
MGKVRANLMRRVGGRVDGKQLSERAKEALLQKRQE